MPSLRAASASRSSSGRPPSSASISARRPASVSGRSSIVSQAPRSGVARGRNDEQRSRVRLAPARPAARASRRRTSAGPRRRGSRAAPRCTRRCSRALPARPAPRACGPRSRPARTPRSGSMPEHRRQQRDRLRRVEPEVRQLLASRHSRRSRRTASSRMPQRVSIRRPDRVEARVDVERRAMQLDEAGAAAADLVVERGHQARLADAGVAADQEARRATGCRRRRRAPRPRRSRASSSSRSTSGVDHDRCGGSGAFAERPGTARGARPRP